MLDGDVNVMCNGHCVDVLFKSQKVDADIVVEYDGWFWHANQEEKDKARNAALVSAGFKLIIIKSNSSVPTSEQLSEAVEQLLGCDEFEIRLDDWGCGPTFRKSKRKRHISSKQGVKKRAGIEITGVTPAECILELDGPRLFVRHKNSDIQRIRLTESESTILAYALSLNGDKRNRGRFISFTNSDTRMALGSMKKRDEHLRTIVSKLRRKISFTTPNHVGLITGMNRNRYSTTVKIRQRPSSRRSSDIQTIYGVWRPFDDARAFVRRLGLNTQIEWSEWSASASRPKDIPTNPQRVYKNKGWVNISDWLGKERRSTAPS